MRAPLSITIDDLQANLGRSLSAAIREMPDLKIEDAKPRLFPDIGTVGFILRDWEGRSLDAGQLHKLSTSVAGKVGLGAAVTVIREGDIIMGFFPIERRL